MCTDSATQEALGFVGGGTCQAIYAPRLVEKKHLQANISRLNRVNKMVIRADHSRGPGTHRPNDISSRTQNDVQSTANRQRAGGPLHLINLPAVSMSRGALRR